MSVLSRHPAYGLCLPIVYDLDCGWRPRQWLDPRRYRLIQANT
jgi:hypothetical protein